MKRRGRWLAVLALVGVLTLLSCGAVESVTTQTQASSREAEARKVLVRLFELHFTKCGPDYYERTALEGLVEYRMTGFPLKEVPLDAADVANGVDVKVVAVGKCRMLRNWSVEGKWSDWRVEDSFIAPNCEMQNAVYMIRRQRGQWQHRTGQSLTFEPEKNKPRCKDVPGYGGPEKDAEIAEEKVRRREDLERPVDVQKYCNALYSGSRAVNNDPSNPYTWRCLEAQTWYNSRNGPIYREVDVNYACEKQYGKEFKAQVGAGANWRCVYKEPVR